MPTTEKPHVDPQPKAVQQTVALVDHTSRLHSEVGRVNRLQAMARTNRDVAWLWSVAFPKGHSPRPGKQPKPKREPIAKEEPQQADGSSDQDTAETPPADTGANAGQSAEDFSFPKS